MRIARKDSWETEPMPAATAEFEYRRRFSASEYAKLSRGHIPREMEDKWFLYLEGATLRAHRSWTGFCIYEIELEAAGRDHVVRRVRANREPEQYSGGEEEDRRTLAYLIDELLLGRCDDPPDGGG